MVGLTGSNGNVVNTYSHEPYAKTANLWRFGGNYGAFTENNSTGLLKIGQRFYDPSRGRWTQQDPVLHPSDPRQWNRFVYVANSPVNLIDPDGMDFATFENGVVNIFEGGVLILGGFATAAAAPAAGPAAPLVGLAGVAAIAGGAVLIGFGAQQVTQP